MKHTRLVYVCALALVGVLLAASVGSADDWFKKNTKARRKALELSQSIDDMGMRIMTYNKSVSEVEEKRGGGVSVGGVVSKMGTWKKNGTEVYGQILEWPNKKDRKYVLLAFKTTDPMMVFAGKIHVGASTKVLENFLGLPLKRLDSYGQVMWSHDRISYCIMHQNGKITEISSENFSDI